LHELRTLEPDAKWPLATLAYVLTLLEEGQVLVPRVHLLVKLRVQYYSKVAAVQ